MVSSIQAKLISTQEMKSGIQESKKSLKEIEVKDGKKKLALALGALGAAGMAYVIGMKKTSIFKKTVSDAKEIISQNTSKKCDDIKSVVSQKLVGGDDLSKSQSLLKENVDATTSVVFKNGREKVETKLSGNTKTVTVTDRIKARKCTKEYTMNNKGHFELTKREKVVSGLRDGYSERKLVEHLSDGTSKTTLSSDISNTQRVIIRDKKGNILSDVTSKLSNNLPDSQQATLCSSLDDCDLYNSDVLDKFRVMLDSKVHSLDEIPSYLATEDSEASNFFKAFLKRYKDLKPFVSGSEQAHGVLSKDIIDDSIAAAVHPSRIATYSIGNVDKWMDCLNIDSLELKTSDPHEQKLLKMIYSAIEDHKAQRPFDLSM